MNFTGKNILVIGGSSGIGLALVNTLAANGAVVYNISRNASTFWASGVRHLALDILGDITTITAFLPDKLHGLIYLPGSINLKPFARLNADDFLNDYRINVVGAAIAIQQCIKQLKAAEGSSVVLLSSVAAKVGMGFHASIAAAKSGVEGLTLSLAAELAGSNIRVNAISPSLTDTPLAQHLLNSPEKQDAAGKRHPLGKYGKPGDISAAIAFLLSTESSWLTGQIIGVDGGLSSLKTS